MAIEYEVVSPVTGKNTTRVLLAQKSEIAESLSLLNSQRASLETDAVFESLQRLAEQISQRKEHFFEALYLETGFIATDCMEIIDGAIEFLRDFELHAGTLPQDKSFIIPHSYSGPMQRAMRIIQQPAHCLAAILPQNAALTLGVIIIASALYAGSRVILRPPLQSTATINLLAEAIDQSMPPPARIAFVHSLAEDFLEACYSSDEVDLIHYIGSSRYAPAILARSFAAGKRCLIDGQGNGIVYVDDTFSTEQAIRLITTAGTRFNGETCTSINGILIKNTIYTDIREGLVDSFRQLRVGHPLESDVQIGPLFSQQQAIELIRSLHATTTVKVLCGNQVDGAYFWPTVVEGVSLHDNIVGDGLFGPAVWIAPVATDKMLWQWLRANRFPLSDSLLSTDENLIQVFIRHSRALRICINVDQSIESMFEPWGAYPPTGLNNVSDWIEKYRRAFIVDGNPDHVTCIPLHLAD